MRKIKITKKIWNYLAVFVLSAVMVSIAIWTLVDAYYLSYRSGEALLAFLPIIGISIIWIFIVPIFMGELAKEKRLKAKSWFKFAIIATLITIIFAIIGIVIPKEEPHFTWRWVTNEQRITTYYDERGNVVTEEEYYLYREEYYLYIESLRDRRSIMIRIFGIGALLPVLSFLSFYFYLFLLFTQRRFSRLDFSHEPVVAVDVHEAEQIDSSQIPDVCPHCKNPNTKKLQDCEWCGNKTC